MKVDRWRDDIPALSQAVADRYRASGVWAQCSIGEQLHRSATMHADATAVIGPDGLLTYRGLDEHTDRIGAGLAQAGIEPGDAILLQVDNSMEAILAWYGVIKSGAIPVATLAVHRAHEIAKIGDIVEARAHIVDASYEKYDLLSFAKRMSATSSTPRLLLTIRSAARSSEATAVASLGAGLSASQARRIVENIAAATHGDDVAVFQLSGGTTSTPKVIPRTHDDYWYNAASYAQALGWDSRARVMHFLPIVHNAGIVLGVHAAHSVGAAIVLSGPQADQLLPAMAAARATDVLTYPSLALEWRGHPAFAAATKHLERVVLTGAKVTEEAFNLFEDKGIRALGLYGATEGLVMVTRPQAPRAFRFQALGTPLSSFDVIRVLQPGAETEVPDGVPGELCYCGPTTLRGYLKAPDRNAEAFTSDGFIRSGDLVARRTIDGAVTYTFEGRIKDLVNRGGEKVNAAEIEGLIAQVPGVARAALVAVPDPRLGERGCLCLQMVDGASPITLADITQFLAAREVAKFKWPERLETYAALPTTPSGKVDKRQLASDLSTGAPTGDAVRSTMKESIA
ncbi:AMP-binding protein [Mycobacterium vicinigordonae]|uniref:AMP-binding protein n=1 Tax=Mycobacterium vicinigordonae TaxID=1719132 RepID=A0A7D6IQ30_9MYCO|nr:AMP-binding protein [Mycobacterium vicinigordonae]QLL06159.1 AMP-binding protein [Mycobacterium vicinigordonae]